MNAERWQKIKEIFNEAAELSAAERQNYITLACGADTGMRREVEKMLAFDSDEILEKNAFDFLSGDDFSSIPEKIGKYKIIREVGRGGMGAVYLAMRADGEFRQKVAVKLIKRGMDSDEILRRFRNERQILAELQHPNIARLLDGGISAEGVPYYAMEYIEGEPIDEFCREKSVTEKLGLFRQVCAAVSYAHNHLVVHRDLKPSNILVESDETPKLLDFGIAKVLSANDSLGTATQLRMMTPAYASPEQVRGEKVTTASDVYSLGVVLYELLTGEKPYQTDGKSYGEVLDLVCNSELSRPSVAVSRQITAVNKNAELRLPSARDERLTKLLRGDLDNILLKALQKEPARRYQSVQEFSEDIRRHLEGLPISARADTFSYRLKKFVHRNKIPVIAAALIFLSLCTGITIAIWQAHKAELEKLRAEKRFAEVRQLANNVVFKYHDAIANLPGATGAREMLVKDALQYLDNLAESADNPQLQRELAAAYLKLGDVQGKQYEANIGDTAGARESYQKAVQLLESMVKSDEKNTPTKVELVKAYDALFANMMRFSDTGKTEVLEKALLLIDEMIAAEPGNLQFQRQKAQLLMRKADIAANFQNGLDVYRQALPIAENLFHANEKNAETVILLARLYQRIGTVFVRLGDEAVKKGESGQNFYAQALPFHEKSLDVMEKLYLADERNLPNRRRYAASLINLAETAAKNNRRDEAKIDQALRLVEQTAAEDSKNLEAKLDVGQFYLTRAGIWQILGENLRAEKELEKAIEKANEVRRADRSNNEVSLLISEAYEALIKIYEQTGDSKKANFYRQKLSETKKS